MSEPPIKERLESREFTSDVSKDIFLRLTACLKSDPENILSERRGGKPGPHVTAIQSGLTKIANANPALGVLPITDAPGVYGTSTASAVLAYKRARRIQRTGQPLDDIVGRMTITQLDNDLKTLSSPQPVPVNPPKGSPEIVPIAPLPSDRAFLEIRRNQIGFVRIKNAEGRDLVCDNPSIAIFGAPPLDFGRVRIEMKEQDISIIALRPGRTKIRIDPPTPSSPERSSLSIIVIAEVTTFFHFLDGPAGIRTAREEVDLEAILKTMNDVYQKNHSGLMFVKSGANPNLIIRGLGTDVPAVRINLNGKTADTVAIKSRFVGNILFNVFFVGSIVDASLALPQDLLAITSKPPGDDPPLRCCICRDPQPGDPAGIDAGITLAHEAGHALGEDDDNADGNSLMFFSQSGQTGTNISKQMAERMLASFKDFSPSE